jgi:fumarate reductase subunit D
MTAVEVPWELWCAGAVVFAICAAVVAGVLKLLARFWK